MVAQPEAATRKMEDQLRQLEAQVKIMAAIQKHIVKLALTDDRLSQVQKEVSANMLLAQSKIESIQKQLSNDYQSRLQAAGRQLAEAGRDLQIHGHDVTREIKEGSETMKRESQVTQATTERKQKEFRKLTEALMEDNLIKRNGPFKIEIKSGQLYIDDKLQPASVTGKYKKRFPGCFKPGQQFIYQADKNSVVYREVSEKGELI